MAWKDSGIVFRKRLQNHYNMKKYRKIIDGKTVIKQRNKIVVVKGGMQYINPTYEILKEDGWEEYIPPQPTEQEIAVMEAEQNAELALGMLSEGDYKVIKCMEAFLCGEPLPYDMQSLHAERQALRLQINNVEQI